MHKITIYLLFLFAAVQGLSSQSPSQPAPLPPVIREPQTEEPNPPNMPDAAKEMQKKQNEQRQADLKRDTDRLLKLSTELKDYVDKSNENILSLDVIKKADEIEKLAHSVKTKMKGDN